MLIVDKVLVSDEVVSTCFCCDPALCRGACCIEGDAGAPLDPLELGDLEDIYPHVKPFLTPEGIKELETNGLFTQDRDGRWVTPLLEDEACAYICYSKDGIAQCAIEKAYRLGKIHFPKPLSCHLYPIRVKSLPDYDALNMHHWFVCQSACQKGEQLHLPLYKFLKEPLSRAYGQAWYESLEKTIKQEKEKKKQNYEK
ncbi:MAG: DUF3109 family protein [Bacteroidales bacterium]|jgi:hypothetical protein|nr:DUF3109 family protein [Bacteroidales bacterium]